MMLDFFLMNSIHILFFFLIFLIVVMNQHHAANVLTFKFTQLCFFSSFLVSSSVVETRLFNLRDHVNLMHDKFSNIVIVDVITPLKTFSPGTIPLKSFFSYRIYFLFYLFKLIFYWMFSFNTKKLYLNFFLLLLVLFFASFCFEFLFVYSSPFEDFKFKGVSFFDLFYFIFYEPLMFELPYFFSNSLGYLEGVDAFKCSPLYKDSLFNFYLVSNGIFTLDIGFVSFQKYAFSVSMVNVDFFDDFFTIPSGYYSALLFPLLLLEQKFFYLPGGLILCLFYRPLFLVCYDLCYKDLGIKTDNYFFFFYGIFLFVLNCNLGGLFPGSICFTVNFFVAFFLSYVIWILSIMIGIDMFGLFFFAHFYLAGRIGLGSFLSFIEIFSTIAKMFTLSIRLFANITAGHIMLEKVIEGLAAKVELHTYFVTSYNLLLIFFAFFLLSSVLFFYEFCVCFVQAYVFVMLGVGYLRDTLFYVSPITQVLLFNTPTDLWYRLYLSNGVKGGGSLFYYRKKIWTDQIKSYPCRLVHLKENSMFSYYLWSTSLIVNSNEDDSFVLKSGFFRKYLGFTTKKLLVLTKVYCRDIGFSLLQSRTRRRVGKDFSVGHSGKQMYLPGYGFFDIEDRGVPSKLFAPDVLYIPKTSFRRRYTRILYFLLTNF